mmetsp:Transcript_66020/g.156453  ORF Transcript_66020/g.156453 Transcript_66020/m.156453 type:complete len:268 (+) Transcript_66020:682-1485(+)
MREKDHHAKEGEIEAEPAPRRAQQPLLVLLLLQRVHHVLEPAPVAARLRHEVLVALRRREELAQRQERGQRADAQEEPPPHLRRPRLLCHLLGPEAEEDQEEEKRCQDVTHNLDGDGHRDARSPPKAPIINHLSREHRRERVRAAHANSQDEAPHSQGLPHPVSVAGREQRRSQRPHNHEDHRNHHRVSSPETIARPPQQQLAHDGAKEARRRERRRRPSRRRVLQSDQLHHVTYIADVVAARDVARDGDDHRLVVFRDRPQPAPPT